MRTCTYKDCTDKYKARGYCKFHYQRWKRGKPLDDYKRQSAEGECEYPDCNQDIFNRRLCMGHYYQLFYKPKRTQGKLKCTVCNKEYIRENNSNECSEECRIIKYNNYMKNYMKERRYNLPPELTQELYYLQRGKCGIENLGGCGKDISMEECNRDHILPQSKFPQFKNSSRNIQLLCRDCNIKKKDKVFPETMEYMWGIIL